jgi:CBS domain-containing protein
MQVRDVMTTSPVCCSPTDTLDRVARLMREHDCGIIPVCDNKRLAGVITDRDIATRAVGAGLTPANVAVKNVMTKPVFTVRGTDDVQAAIDLMESKQVRRLPVLNESEEVVGVVAPSDLAPIFASMNVADFLLAVSYWSRPVVTRV